MNKFVRIVLVFFATQVVATAFAQILRRRYLQHDVGKGGVNAVAVQGGVRERIKTRSFTGGYARAIMGGVELDLTESTIRSKPATIEVTIVMGGVAIEIPDAWVVDVQADVIAGGVDVGHAHVKKDERSKADLVVTGRIVMGGLSIDSSDED